MLRVEVFKQFGGRTWENVYLVGRDDFGEDVLDADVGSVIALAEQTFHCIPVEFLYARISTLTPNDNNYITVPLGFNGARTLDTGAGLLPLFNTLRVDIQATQGRPSRKFYRGVLTEVDTNYTTISAACLDAARVGVENMMTQLATDTGYRLRDPQGTALVAAVAYPRVQMRQLNRGRRRPVPAPVP